MASGNAPQSHRQLPALRSIFRLQGVRLESDHDDRILRADDTLVLFGDLQPRMIARETTVEQARLSKFAGALAHVAKIYGLPLIITTTNPEPTITEITSVFPNVRPVQRTIPAAFRNPPLINAIRDTAPQDDPDRGRRD